MEAIIKWFEPTSVFQVVSAVSIIIVLVMVLKGKVSKIGKDGVTFREGDTESELRSFMKRSDDNDTKLLEDIQSLSQDVSDSKADREQLHQTVDEMAKDMRTLRLESLKTQILLQETSFERKLYLYDDYKKLGGNGWMDIYIGELKKEHI